MNKIGSIAFEGADFKIATNFTKKGHANIKRIIIMHVFSQA